MAEAAAKAATAAAAAAERLQDPSALAAWYAGRAREFDARAGQLRHAATMCRLGVDRVVVFVGARGGRRGERGGHAVVEELLRLDRVLQHLASLVYAGSVSPSVTFAAWEGMGLEERLSAVLAASSAETIAADVRNFARATITSVHDVEGPHESESRSHSALSREAAAAVPPHLEGILVRVLGALVESGPSAENMEACAAVAKASRPEVPEDDRLIRKPEALLTLLLDACYAWTETAPDQRAMEAAWDLLECVPARQPNVDASLQDRADALEGHLYATQVLQTYGLAPPLTRYLDMGGGAEGSPSRDVERYNAFARGLVDQMCAVAMDRAGMRLGNQNGGGGGGGVSRLGVGQMWHRGAKMVGVGGGGGGGGSGGMLDGASKAEITRLHKDVSRLQSNAWQGLGARWAIRRVLQAVVEAGQFDVARALVESSSSAPSKEGREGKSSDGGGQGGEAQEEESKRPLERRAIAEDVLLSAAAAHFNAAPSFEGGEELEASQRWLDLLPWSSPALDRERRLHGAGRLAHDLGATDLVPLQLRLRLEGERGHGVVGVNDGHGSNHGVNATVAASAAAAVEAAIEVIREVLRCNPDAFRDGDGNGLERSESWAVGGRGDGDDGESVFGAGKGGLIRTPPGTGLVRLAGLLSLDSADEIDRVRALVAKAALRRGDGAAACEILSAAILRRPPRQSGRAGDGQRGRGHAEDGGGGGGSGGGEAVLPFASELCEALDLVVEWGSGSGSRCGPAARAVADAPARTADLCAQALSRCPASQIGRLLGPWSRFEAIRYLAGTADTGDVLGSGGGGGVSAVWGGGGGVAAVASVLVEAGMDECAAATVGRIVGVRGDENDEGLPGRSAEGALRLLLLREHGSSPSSISVVEEEQNSATELLDNAEPATTATAAAAAAVAEAESGNARENATNRLCILLALAELRSASSPGEEKTMMPAPEVAADLRFPGRSDGGGGGAPNLAGGPAFLVELAGGAAEDFGVGAVERGVGYALAATDGRAVLGALRALLEQAEVRVKALRDVVAEHGGDAAAAGGKPHSGADDEVGAAAVAAAEPDESLVQALHRMGISSNRARRACVATRNASREAALAWCVEHSADPAMDAPFVSSGRRSASGRPMGVGTVGGGGGGGNAGDGDVVGQRRGEEALRVAARLRGIAAAALEAYVRARLSAIGESSGRGGGSTGGGGGGGDVGLEGSGVPSEEIGELVAVLTSFRQRQSLGQAEDKVRAVLPAAVDLGRFARDQRYRQSLRDVVTLSFDYSSTDVWGVAAAAATYLLGPGYAELRRGLTAPSTATRVETELRSGSDNAGRSTGRGSLLLDTLLGSGRGAQGLLELARGVFIGAADGKDLHHLDLLLRLMSEAAARSGVAVGGEPGGAARGSGSGSGSGSVAKKPIERRLNAHCGLVRRLLKAAPQGLDYKALVGEDPLADPLADPQDAAGTAAVAEGTPPAPLSNSSTGSGGVTLKRTAAGLAAARARAMAELRSVAGLEHAPALSKLAARIPGISGSAVYLAVGQRVLCGETGGLSPEALGLLRGDTGGDAGGGGGYSSEECEAASASVYHLLFPLFQKMGSEDLLEVTAAACAPNVAGGNDESLGYYPCRRENPWTMAAAPTNNSTAPAALHPLKSGGPFLDRMEPLHLTLRCRRRILAAASAASRSASSGGGSGGGTGSETGTAAAVSAVEIGFTRLKCLMDALSSLSAPWSGPATTATGTGAVARARVSHALEMAWAMSNRARRGGNGADRESGHAAASVQQGAIAKAAGAATDMVLAGAPPSAVDGVCSCMQSALGVRGTEAAWEAQANADGSPSPTAAAAAAAAAGGMDGQVEATDVLNPSRVYATATSSALVRLVSQDAEDRTCALEDLWAACGAAGPSTDAGAPAIGAAKDQAWQVLAPILDMFGREGDLGLEGSGGGGGGGGNVAAPSVVLWARAEVLTLLRSFGTGSSSGGGGGGSGGSSDGRKFGGDGRVEESSAPYTANGSGGDRRWRWRP
ncbi:unnamed protein product [Pylaiella littoralis]